jgi:guanylate kinase
MGRLVIISGPSCVGKSPLYHALQRHHPELTDFQPVVLYNSRPPRPSEQDGVDYHFRSREDIEKLRDKDGFIVMDVRGDLQALDTAELNDTLSEGDVFYEGNPFVGRTLLEVDLPEGVERLSVFVSPLAYEEVAFLAERGIFEETLIEVMRRKLLRRMHAQKGHLSGPDLDEVERRAGSAPQELALAGQFDVVLANHDGEDSDNWDAFYYPLGDARRTCQALVSLLRDGQTELADDWPEPSCISGD